MDTRKNKTSTVLVDIFLILVVFAMYFVTSEPDIQAAVASPVYRGQAVGGIALQIAVDWDAAALVTMLDTLKESDNRVTFAVSGSWARDNPEMLRRMVNDGQEIATMGYYAQSDGNRAWVTKDIEDSLNEIQMLCGKRPCLYYSGNRALKASSRAAKKIGIVHVLCTVDLRCAAGTREEIIQRALEEPINGSIMLMQPTTAAAEALPGIINGLKMKGFSVVSTSDVLAASDENDYTT